MGKENSGFTAEEMAELQADPGEETETETVETVETPQPSQPAKPDAKPPADGKDAKPPAGYVPTSALHEARQHAKEANERAKKVEGMWERLQQNAAEASRQAKQKAEDGQIPPKETDPVGYLEAELAKTRREVEALRGDHQKRQQQEQLQGQTQEMLNRYAASVRDFTRENKDFQDAYNFYVNAMDEELEALGYDSAEERTNAQQYYEGQVVGRAIRREQDPAKALYNAAIKRGYKKPGSEAPADETKLDKLQRGAKASKSLAGSGKSEAEGEMSITRLTELYDTDPKAADAMFQKMARAGLLG